MMKKGSAFAARAARISDHELLRRVGDIDQDTLAGLQLRGVAGENAGEGIVTGVGHGDRCLGSILLGC